MLRSLKILELWLQSANRVKRLSETADKADSALPSADTKCPQCSVALSHCLQESPIECSFV